MQNKTIKEYKNLYELRKTIRFILEPEASKRLYRPMKDNGDLEVQIKDFICKYNQVIQIFEGLVYFIKSEDSEERKLNKKISIKHSWLRNYTKNYFFDVREKICQRQGNKVAINDANVNFLDNSFRDWLNENKECLEQLKNSRKRTKTELAFWIRKITKRSNFNFIFELFDGNIEHKNNNCDIDLVKKLLDDCRPLLTSLEEKLLPIQSLGFEIERASLNYYTVNKKPKNYPEEIQNKKDQLQQRHRFSLDERIDERILFSQVGFTDANLFIVELKEAMKKFKVDKKSKFYEFVNRDGSYQELKKNQKLKLLDDINERNFNKFKNETDKQKKGKHFQFSFQKYKNFCKCYKDVAVELGRIKADIRSLEKEKIDAERLRSWGVILEKDKQKYILTIPRINKNLQNAKKHIDGLQNYNNGKWKLYAFDSLTLRALDKLCFGLDKNTFIPEIKKELRDNNKSFFIKDKLKRKDQFSKDGKELMKFYQSVLGLNATGKMLAINNFKNFDELISEEYEQLVDFEKSLKQICYYKKSISISEDEKNRIINDYQGNFYKITSYDLEKNDREILASLENKENFDRNYPEYHTKIWLDFWTDENARKNYKIRLNPEFKINFVKKRQDELKGRSLGKLQKNRRLNNQFLLSTTITLNAHAKSVDLAYQTTDDIKKYIEGYNKEFNQKLDSFDIFYYGLDRGQKELLTLGLFKFSKTEKVNFINQDGNQGEYNKPEFIDLEVYELKKDKYLDKDYNNRVAYKSIDQFINNPEIVRKTSIKSCLDLSCAKLVKGKLVVNGDIATYLELKRVSALRKIWKGNTEDKFKSDEICFDANMGSLFLSIENRGKLENENLYFFDERFDNIVPLAVIKDELQEYYNKIKNKDDDRKIISIDKINHLRDGLCANVVGIINYLQQKYFGVLIFENLDVGNKNKRISEFAGNLASRIEWKLLQKFQTLCLVPPNLKQIMTLQSSKKINQIGVVLYVEASGTSNECPHCGVKNTDKSQKWSNHAYECMNSRCNFSTKNEQKRNDLIALDNSDKVAAYNIAKRGFKNLLGKDNEI